MGPAATWRSRRGVAAFVLATVLVAAAALLATSDDDPGDEVTSRRVTTTAPTRARPPSSGGTTLPVPAALVGEGVSLRAGPRPVPLELHIPAIGVAAPVVGVGITPDNVMDAPQGGPHGPEWHQAFWYRGSAIPGAPSTALLAGHADDPLGGAGVFGAIDELKVGDDIIVRDSRTDLKVHFAVTESVRYTLAQASEPAVLNRIYGPGPVAAKWPQPSKDGLAHLTLITCAGTFRGVTHDHRQVIYATRTG